MRPTVPISAPGTQWTVPDLRELALRIRLRAVRMVAPQGFGYLGQALSSAEQVAAVFATARPGVDRLVCSPGHYVIGPFAAAAELGLLDEDAAAGYGQNGSPVEAIGTERSPVMDYTCGSLGQGLSAALGFALSDRLRGSGARIFTMVSDGELEEGQVWEAALFAAHHHLDRLVVLLDANNSQVDGPVDSITTLEPIAAKWSAFGWHVQDLDGHDPDALAAALAGAAAATGRPSVVVCRTSTRHGLDCLPPTRTGTSSSCPPSWPRPRWRSSPASWRPFVREPPYPTELKPYGRALVDLARRRDEILCLSGDLTRQCEVDLFQAEIPDRFIHAGMAEANMMSMAGALARCGHIPFVHTFGVFATRRPFDQIANAIAYPGLPVRIIGFMPGVSTPGGPSHQAIDDVALMRTLPNMTVVDVADAVEVRQVAAAVIDLPGPVYVRLKRGEIPVIFDEDHVLRLGQAEVLLPGDDVALFASGMMLAAALAAARALAGHAVSVSVINVPTVKPLDTATVRDAAAGAGRGHRREPHHHRRPGVSRGRDDGRGRARQAAAPGRAARHVRGRLPDRPVPLRQVRPVHPGAHRDDLVGARPPGPPPEAPAAAAEIGEYSPV